MSLLRETIRNLILEVFELDDEQQAKRDRLIDANYGDKTAAHLAGLDTAEEQREDRDLLRKYQERLRSGGRGKKLIRSFMNAEVTILHDITYEGAAARGGLSPRKKKKTFAHDWIKQYGKSGDDVLSTVTYFPPPTSSISADNLRSNARFVLQSKGLIMKGYPVFVAVDDVMTQTIGALDDKMKAHWSNSGIPKRPSKEHVGIGDDGELIGIVGMRHLKKLGASNETLLDNWEVIGTYINTENHSEAEVEEWIEDSLEWCLLPCNVYNASGKLTRHEP